MYRCKKCSSFDIYRVKDVNNTQDTYKCMECGLESVNPDEVIIGVANNSLDYFIEKLKNIHEKYKYTMDDRVMEEKLGVLYTLKKQADNNITDREYLTNLLRIAIKNCYYRLNHYKMRRVKYEDEQKKKNR